MIGEYKNGNNIIAVIGQNGRVIAPIDSSYLFYFAEYCITAGPYKIDLSYLDTSNVTNMEGMFSGGGCGAALTNIIFGNNFDTSNVTSMSNMFLSCSLTSLDLSNFDTAQVTDMSYMFYNCGSLTKITVGCNWVINESTDTSSMFDHPGVSSVTKVCNE